MSPLTTNLPRHVLTVMCTALLLAGVPACQEPVTDPAPGAASRDVGDHEALAEVSSQDNSGGSAGASGGSAGGSAGGSTCTTDAQCGGGDAKCDHNTNPGRCVTRKEIGETCSTDQECNGGLNGTTRICINSRCADACRTDTDCPGTGPECQRTSGAPTGRCRTTGAVCQLDYPSVSILGIATPTVVRQAYNGRGCADMMPACMIDTNNIVDATTRQKLAYNSLQLSPHITLYEMSHQSKAVSAYVYLDPDFIRDLEATRVAYGKPWTITSGFRSALHQQHVCAPKCGGALWCAGCARCSNHMDGKGADLHHSLPHKCDLAKPNCTAGQMHLIYDEHPPHIADHLHVDIGPKNHVCRYKGTGHAPFDCGH